jgi:Na+-driven multidrug efflux pump
MTKEYGKKRRSIILMSHVLNESIQRFFKKVQKVSIPLFSFFFFSLLMSKYTNISVIHLQTPEEIKRALAVRHQVFVLEQGYSVEIESDK